MKEQLKKKFAQIRERGEKFAAAKLLVDGAKVPIEIQSYRIDICNSCPNLNKIRNSCALCGCFMGVKTWLKGQECPIGKWDKEE